MLLTHFIVIILIILAFCCIVQYASNLYIYRKLHNQGVDVRTSKNIAKDVSILMSVFFGILTFILICIATQAFDGSVII